MSDYRLIPFNKAISKAAKCRDLREVRRQFELIAANGLRPDIYSFNSLINACIQAGRASDAFRVYENVLSLVDQCMYSRESGK